VEWFFFSSKSLIWISRTRKWCERLPDTEHKVEFSYQMSLLNGFSHTLMRNKEQRSESSQACTKHVISRKWFLGNLTDRYPLFYVIRFSLLLSPKYFIDLVFFFSSFWQNVCKAENKKL
jgi:hypothetical protein